MKHFQPRRHKAIKQTTPLQPFADWCSDNAAELILPLELNADIVTWIVAVMQSSGEMRGIENISTLERVLKQRRTPLRFPSEADFEKALLTARVLFRAYENGVVS